jgi:toxin ParE1/3/4
MSFRISDRAQQDLDEIWDYVYYASNSADVARKLVQTIASRFSLLASYPHIGRAREDLRPGLRSFPVGAYIILYRL